MFIEGEIPAVVNTGSSNGGNSGFGYGNDAWVLIILFALIFGWGRNGFGGNGNGGGYSGVADNYVLATDFATIERKLDGVNNGLCDGFYAQNTNMLNGFASVQQTLCQGFSGVNSSINTSTYETIGAINGLSSQLASCCCGIEKSLLENRYLDAQNTCALTNTINSTTRDIIDNQNANFRALHDELIANKIEAKNERIAEQQATITALQLKASQEAQNAYLLSELKACPKPAYVVQPSQPVTFPTNCCGNVSFANYGGCGASVL